MVSLSPGAKQEVGRGSAVDICFVFDTTGSMSDKIDGLIECMVDLVGELSRLSLDWRITTVPFGDLTVPGDRVVEDQPFVTDRESAVQQLRTMPQFSGGGNTGESSLEALLAALRKPFRPQTVKVIILLTDEPALHSRELSPAVVGRALRQAEVITFVASPNLPYYQSWAQENGGRWYEIGSAMDTGAIVEFLRALVRQVATVAHAVHALGGGSVRRYLKLGEGDSGSLPDKQ